MSRRLTTALVAVLCGWLALAGAAMAAVTPDEMLKDPALEARARQLDRELRCLVCQNESIDDSNADLAHDLRLLVRQRIRQGDSDEAVKQYLVDRYGSFVLLRPPVERGTWFLWFGPAAVLLAGGGLSVGYFRRRPRDTAPPDLSADERARVDALLAGEGGTAP